nr:hypothetical protein [Dechloromonas sp.]
MPGKPQKRAQQQQPAQQLGLGYCHSARQPVVPCKAQTQQALIKAQAARQQCDL